MKILGNSDTNWALYNSKDDHSLSQIMIAGTQIRL